MRHRYRAAMDTPSPTLPAQPRGWAAFFGALTWRGVAVALTLAVLVAAALSPHFAPPFPVLLGRTLFISMVLLLAFTAAGQWRQGWLPRWMAQVLSVVLAAPLATLAVYLLSVGGNVTMLFDWARVTGFLLISGSGLVLGLVLALGW